MKLLQTVVFLVTALLANTAVWPDAITPRAQVMKKQLNLTDKQTQQIDKILKETRAAQKVVRQQLKDLSSKQEEQIKSILTPEQAKKYEEINNEPPAAEGQSPESPQPESPSVETQEQRQEPAPQPAK